MTLEEELAQANALVKAVEKDMVDEVMLARHREYFVRKRARDEQKRKALAQFGPRPVKATNGKEGA